MAGEDRGPAFVLSLLAGTLLFFGGVLRAASIGLLPNRAFGSSFRFVTRTFPNGTLGLGPALLQTSAILGVVSGMIILLGAVMLGSKIEQNTVWGTVIIAFSAIGLLGGGGFLVGSLLGFLAGIMAILWRPVTRIV